MERIDKIISNQLGYSRKEVKELIKRKEILVNDILVEKSDVKVDPIKDKIMIKGKELSFQKFVYFILNKPKGYVSATKDNNEKTVLELIPEEYRHRNLFPAGRLDKDTTGLMLITDDGEFAHEILSPKKHISKTYEVIIDQEITQEMVTAFKDGIKLQEEVCAPAILKKISSQKGIVILTEGKYHQIKRMFQTQGAKVLELKRIAMGKLTLEEDLKEGEYKKITEEELKQIKG